MRHVLSRYLWFYFLMFSRHIFCISELCDNCKTNWFVMLPCVVNILALDKLISTVLLHQSGLSARSGLMQVL